MDCVLMCSDPNLTAVLNFLVHRPIYGSMIQQPIFRIGPPPPKCLLKGWLWIPPAGLLLVTCDGLTGQGSPGKFQEMVEKKTQPGRGSE